MTEKWEEVIFKKQSKKMTNGTRGTWPLDHPLIVAIKNLQPDSDECIETETFTNSDLAQLIRRLKEVLPIGYGISYRTDGGRQGYGLKDREAIAAHRAKAKRRWIWLVRNGEKTA